MKTLGLGVLLLIAIFSFKSYANADYYVFTAVENPYLGYAGTFARGMNEAGYIVGEYGGRDNKSHGFLYDGSGIFTIDHPMGTTGLTAINSHGQIAGHYEGSDGLYHMFIASPVPIPGAVWLFASGLVGLAGYRRKYRKI